MPKLHFTTCPHCQQPVIRRGHSVLNLRGTPINHHLSCPGPQTPDASKSAGPTGNEGSTRP